MPNQSFKISNLTSSLRETFGSELVLFLKELGRYLEQSNTESYLVGGMVRDSLLSIPSVDIDISLRSATIHTAPQIVEEIFIDWKSLFPKITPPISWEKFEPFLTAKLFFARPLFGQSEVIDFATARAERYDAVGARPIVWPSTLEDDLLRRDFTVNAIAASISTTSFGALVDPANGLEDLVQKKLRVIHPRSFSDDPVRLLRGFRLIARLGFSWEESTRGLVEEAIAKQYLRSVSPARRFDELRKTLVESSPVVVCELCKQGELLSQLIEVSSVTFSSDMRPYIEGLAIEGRLIEPWQWRLVNLFAEISNEKFVMILKEAAISKADRNFLSTLHNQIEQQVIQ